MKIFLILFCFLTINIAFGQRSNNNKQGKTSLKNTSGFSLKTPSCEELIHYRDIELVSEFDAVTKKYRIKYKLDPEAIQDAKRRKDELLNERGWDELMSTGTAISDRGVTIAQIAAIIKLYCNLFQGVMEMAPGEKVVTGAVKSAKFTAEQIHNFIEKGKDIKEISNGKLMDVEIKYILNEGGIAGKATNVAWEFYKNLQELIKIPEEREKLESEVIRILGMLENAIAKYEEDLEKNRDALDQEIQIVNGITEYLVEHHCKAKTPEEDTKGLGKKESGEITPVVEHNKKTNGKNYYIFFTIKIDIDDKLTDIISKPIPYNGNPNDDISTDDKDDFIDQIKLQIPSQKDLKKEELRNRIYVNYGKPNSTSLLKSKEEVFDAIEAYKQNGREAISGLEGAEIDFFQLK